MNTKSKDEDNFASTALKKLRVEHSQSLSEIAKLKAQLYNAQCEVSDLRSELKETRAILGEAIVSASKQKAATAGPSRRPKTMEKRARSPSIEIIEQPLPRKMDDKPDSKHETQKWLFQGKAYVSVPAHNANRDSSYPKPSSCNQSRGAKRRRIELGGAEPNTSLTGTPSPLSSLSPTPELKKAIAPGKEIKPEYASKVRLPQSIFQAYLSSSPRLPISPPPLLDLQVPRKFLRLAYGGSDQRFLQFVKDIYNPSGPTKRRMVFPMLDMNPAMPSQPGDPGLVFASRHEILKDETWTVFCKPPETGKALWLYLGEYTSVLCGKMSKDEFRIQRDAVKAEWAKLLLRTKLLDVYVSMRARIALRKVGVLPVNNARESRILVKDEVDNIKAKKGIHVTEEDIIAALNAGDEGIDIIRMTCVKYDHVFANDMKAKFANYDKLLAADKRKNKSNDEEDEGKDDNDIATRRVSGGGRYKGTGKEKARDDEEFVDDFDEPLSDADDSSLYRATDPKPRHNLRTLYPVSYNFDEYD